MSNLRRDFRDAPVPIRLSCSFSNGIILNYYARAVSCNSRVLKVLSVNPFDREVQLLVAAPFISGITRCHVASVTRSKRQAATFEIDLRFIESPTLIAVSSDATPASAPSEIARVNIASAASELAMLLDASSGMPFGRAFSQAECQNPELKVRALIFAVIDLARQKGLMSAGLLGETVKRRSKSAATLLRRSRARAILSRRAG